MRVNEVKETKEVVIKTEYIAADGKVFSNKEECNKYEKTCRCVIMGAYTPLVKASISEYELFDTGCEDFYYDIVEIKDETDLEIVNKAIKFANERARLVDRTKIGTTIMVAKDYDGTLTGYHTSIEDILERIRTAYDKALND